MRRHFLPLLSALIALLLFITSAQAAVRDDYDQAKEQYQEFLKDKRAMQRRDLWVSHANSFLSIAKQHPAHRLAPGCYYWAGYVYRDMYAVSLVQHDRDKAIEVWRELIRRYPTSTLCDDVWTEIVNIHELRGDKAAAYLELEALLDKYPQGDKARQARIDLARLRPFAPTPTPAPTPAPTPTPRPTPNATPVAAQDQQPSAADQTLVGVRYWTYPFYTRVVVDLSDRVDYKANFIEADPQNGAPRRLYVDFYGAGLHPTLIEPIMVNDGLLNAVRCGEPQQGIARVVLDLDAVSDYRLFTLDSPFRLVIDINAGTTAQQTGERQIRRIVLDAGHGGRDPGAVGRHRGKVRYEKTYTLDLVKRIRPILERELGVEVVFTRSDDRFVPLEQRTAIANQQRADLFVSVHINASRRSAPSGFSTYYLAPKADPTDEELIALLAQENDIDLSAARGIDLVLGDLAFSDKISESSYLAEAVQKAMVGGLRTKYGGVIDRGVKRAPFYVLVGAHMPCVLIEAGFITNSKEAGRLAQPNFRYNLADAIARGIIEYVRQLEH
ncbi:MAG: N-acetylmuramoyl-L-alanine amidase [Candidatus Alcyoniella australis]|nr:N-acetylmuramoyl-L-alanine amidase [Candidatus Alcyoniella australis]